jgi:hypothetical protein
MSLIRQLKDIAKSTLPDSIFLSLLHRKYVGRFPNLIRPSTFNEKILLRSLKPDPRYAMLTDKLAVRSYVSAKLAKEHLVTLFAAPAVFTQAVFDSLPASFVMKANHGSSFVEIVRDKSQTSFERLQRLTGQWLKTDFYRISREKHYSKIRPQIFFEQLLLDKAGKVPPDYKVHCFRKHSSRPVVYISVISDRFGDATRGDIFDEGWHRLDFVIGYYPCSIEPPSAPPNLASILDIAKVLSEGFDYVRVDLYALDDKVYFGELTFTPGAGVLPFLPDRIDYEWGQLLSDC